MCCIPYLFGDMPLFILHVIYLCLLYSIFFLVYNMVHNKSYGNIDIIFILFLAKILVRHYCAIYQFFVLWYMLYNHLTSF